MLGALRWAEALSGGSELAMKLAIIQEVASLLVPTDASLGCGSWRAVAISQYSQMRLTIKAKPPYHSMHFGARAPISIRSKSRTRVRVVTIPNHRPETD